MDKDTNIGRRPGGVERPHESGAAAPGRGGRMSRQRANSPHISNERISQDLSCAGKTASLRGCFCL